MVIKRVSRGGEYWNFKDWPQGRMVLSSEHYPEVLLEGTGWS